MSKIGIVTADEARARFITAEVLEDPGFDGSPRMSEHELLHDPLGDTPPREQFSDRPSRKPSGAGPRGANPASDDHRDRHHAEDARRFAQQIVAALQRFAHDQTPARLLLAAGPRMLGVLRRELAKEGPKGLARQEVDEDLAGKSLPEIREVLERRGLLPQPNLPRGGTYRPRGQEPSTR
jgi:protein required for attachment to host cells